MMYCASFACHMSKRACEANQRLTDRVIAEVLEDEMSIFQLDEVSASRLLVCGKCPVYSNYEQAKKAMRSSISALADKLSSMDLDSGADPELLRRRRAEITKEYRSKNAEVLADRARKRRIDNRIVQLKGG